MRYNKLIRDFIPDIMDSKKVTYIVHKATPGEFAVKLREKLLEEVQEYLKELNSEELIDILEVVYAIGELHELTKEQLEELRQKKANERGIFKKQLILDESNG